MSQDMRAIKDDRIAGGQEGRKQLVPAQVDIIFEKQNTKLKRLRISFTFYHIQVNCDNPTLLTYMLITLIVCGTF